MKILGGADVLILRYLFCIPFFCVKHVRKPLHLPTVTACSRKHRQLEDEPFLLRKVNVRGRAVSFRESIHFGSTCPNQDDSG